MKYLLRACSGLGMVYIAGVMQQTNKKDPALREPWFQIGGWGRGMDACIVARFSETGALV